MSTLMTLTEHIAPSSPTDILLKMRNFLESIGWTITEWRTSCGWDGTAPYTGWTAGSDSFLQVKTTGYGKQNAIYRFWACDAMSTYGYPETSGNLQTYTRGVIICSMIDFRYETYTTDSATHPIHQNCLNNSSWTNTYDSTGGSNNNFAWALQKGSAVKMWLFGNDKFCWVSVQQTTAHVTHIFFGVPELINQDWEGGQILTKYEVNAQYHPCDWNRFDTYPGLKVPVVKLPGNYNKDNQVMMAIGDNICVYNRQSTIQPANLAQALAPGNWSGIRPMMRDVMYYYSTTEGLWRPFAYSPWSWVYFVGLGIGSELVYGTEVFTIVPIRSDAFLWNTTPPGLVEDGTNLNSFGIAFRTE